MEQNEEKSSSPGCGLVLFCLLADTFWWIYYWDKWTKLDYWPYLIIANIVISAIIVWYFYSRK